jgi:hypothetical protein
MPGYQDLIDWCNGAAMPNNRRAAVSVNLYQVPAPNEPAEAAWAGTLSKSSATAPQTFVLDGELQPLDGTHWPVQLHIVIDTQSLKNLSATISGHHIKPEWQTAASQLVFNSGDYYIDAVISGKVELIPTPTNWTMLYPIIPGPTYTYHPPTP